MEAFILYVINLIDQNNQKGRRPPHPRPAPASERCF